MHSLATTTIRSLLTLVLGALVASGCTTEDPGTTKAEFAAAAARSVCQWGLSCCDQAERADQLPSADETACIQQATAQYANLISNADEAQWSAKGAAACVGQIDQAAESCPAAFSPAATIAECTFVTADKKPGDLCDNTWQCTTKFCKNGVCANPLAENSTCTELEPCANGLRCVAGTCRALQPDGATCVGGSECISGACGGGKCVVSPTFTCDGAGGQ